MPLKFKQNSVFCGSMQLTKLATETEHAVNAWQIHICVCESNRYEIQNFNLMEADYGQLHHIPTWKSKTIYETIYNFCY